MPAVGFKEYWREPWNRFDFACVALSALGVFFRAAFLGTSDGEKAFAFDAVTTHSSITTTTVTTTAVTRTTRTTKTHYEKDTTTTRTCTAWPVPRRAWRTAERFLGLAKVARLVRLVKHLKGLRDLLETLVASLPAFWNVGALVALLFFIYAYVGVILFGTTPENEHERGGSLDEPQTSSPSRAPC